MRVGAITVVWLALAERIAAHEHALVTVATAVGALLLARAVDDPRLSDAVREAALKHLAPSGA